MLLKTSYYDQHEYDIRCEWGLAGISQLLSSSEVIVIVDVLSFSTSVNIAVGNGAIVYPYRGNEKSATGYAHSLSGCLRNARAVAQAAQKMGNRIGIIPAGERWKNGSLRPALEDFIGAGAIIYNLNGTCSPEAEAIYSQMSPTLTENLQHCSSGKELVG